MSSHDAAAYARRTQWERRGRPFALIRPLADLKTTLARHGYTVYGIGNDDHLLADPPEDHTPYSQTGWPGARTYGRGYALDVMPPKPGAKSAVNGRPLPTLQQLGAQLLRDRKASVAGASWLKYMNWEPDRDNGGRCFTESFQPTHRQSASGDRGHIHLSARTGIDDSTIAAGYDPVARFYQEDDMEQTEKLLAKTSNPGRTVKDWIGDDSNLRDAWVLPAGSPVVNPPAASSVFGMLASMAKDWGPESTRQRLRDEAILTAVNGKAGAAEVLARVDARAAEQMQALQAMRSQIAAELAPLLIAAVGQQLAGQVAPDALADASEVALRRVLGGLDGMPA